MISELETLKAKGLPDILAAKAMEFLESGNPAIPRNISTLPKDWRYPYVGKALLEELPWNDTVRNLLLFFTHLSGGAPGPDDAFHGILHGALNHVHDEAYAGASSLAAQVVGEVESHHGSLGSYVTWHLGQTLYRKNWSLAEDGDANLPFTSPVANLIFKNLDVSHARAPKLLTVNYELFPALAIHRPEITEAWCMLSAGFRKAWSIRMAWQAILDATRAFDEICLTVCETLKRDEPCEAFHIMRHFVGTRGPEQKGKTLELASLPEVAPGAYALEFLLEHLPDEVLSIMTRAFEHPEAGMRMSDIDGEAYAKLYQIMLDQWDCSGSALLPRMVAHFGKYRFPDFILQILPPLAPIHYPALREGFLRRLESTEARERTELWRVVGHRFPAAFLSDFEGMLIGKSKPLREIAARALSEASGRAFVAKATEILTAKTSDARHGAALFFEALADPETKSVIQAALDNEASDDVRQALHRALQACGGGAGVAAQSDVTGFAELEASILKQTNKLKAPTTAWLKVESLPAVSTLDGKPVAPALITFLLAKQSKHKEIAAAPDIVPLLAHIDRETSAPFALALVEGFLNSEQAAGDRWALALGGLLGDKRVIPPLLSRIHDWCENSRHKLAEYAAQAIALLPGDEPLMVLDTLANRYRSKFKNVGAACAAAFNAAAAARGITPDELGDMVVPRFDFDDEGIRRFDWEGGGVSAELGPDFKLSWFDPETEKSWKSLPATAPASVKEEVTTLTKLLRETVKSQTARLEQALVRQRRWPVTRWRELYETHPVLRSFASRLVWGIFDAKGKLLRTFRRYPNGLLADAAGALEELPESDTLIGMVHPLELDEATLAAWRAHLARMKVSPPFPQIDRPVERLDPMLGNRRQLALTEGKTLSAGSFKSRAEKRGWVRGSVVDAGGVTSYYKLYPGAGVEVTLPTEGLWVGFDPMDTVTLGSACFAKAGTIDRGSYVYDEPGPDDPRVLRFDQVPPVVYSETLADLKAIIESPQ